MTSRSPWLRWRVFALTWLAYATYYLTRKPFSVDKSTLATTAHLSMGELSAIDTGFLAAYALGQFCSGMLADRFGARRVLVLGMTAVTVAALAFGCSSTLYGFGASFVLMGLVQATGWSGTVRAMTPWFLPHERGRVMGPWSTCYQVGGLAATALAGAILVRYHWQATFFVPAALTILVAALLFFALPEPPSEERVTTRGDDVSIYRNPLLWTLGAAYFVCKLVRYAFLFWLPYYFTTRLNVAPDRASYYSLVFELGGVIGSTLAGTFSDRLARRGVLAIAMLLGLAASLAWLSSIDTLKPFIVGVGLCGFFLFGPDALISGIAAQDLGGNAGVGRASGLINGVGSLGGLCQGFVTVAFVERWSWSTLFAAFVAATIVAAALCTPYALEKRSAS